jgi:hypothetical protein
LDRIPWHPAVARCPNGQTWDASDPGVIGWRNEMAAPDGSWFLIEEYSMVPVQQVPDLPKLVT